MGFVYGDENCIDPLKLRAECIRQNFPINWFGLANQYRCPLGCAPGQGALLLSYDSLNKLDLSAANDGYRILRVESADTANGVQFVKFPSILIVGQATAINPASDAAVSGSGGLPTAYLVPIADKRWLFWDRGATVTKRYNVRDDSTGAYVTTTLNGGVAWTWQQIVDDLWPSGLGTSPTLPFTPDGTPEGLWWHLQTPMFALQELLNRLACDLKYNPVADTFSIVRLGVDTSNVAATAVARFNKLNVRILDSYSLISQLAQLPEKIKVEFRVKKPYTDGTVPYYTIEQSVTPAAGAAAAGTYITLQDDLYAQWDGASITNAAALTSRATERVTDFVRKRQYFDSGEDYTYSGAIDVSEALGGFYRLVAWEDRGMMGGGVLARLQAGDLLDQRLENWRRGDTHDDGARWHYFKRDMPVYEAEATSNADDDCCENEFTLGSGLSLGGGLVFGGGECGCVIGCDCGCCGGGGGSSPSGCSADGWAYHPGVIYCDNHLLDHPASASWCGSGPCPSSPPSGPATVSMHPSGGGSYTVNLSGGSWQQNPMGGTSPFYGSTSPCEWVYVGGYPACGGGVTVPIGGIGDPGPFPPSQPRPPMGGGGGGPRPPGAVNNACYTSCMAAESVACVPGSAGYAQCMATADAMCHHACDGFTRGVASLGGGMSFGDGLTLSGPPAPFIFPNQGGLGIDASTAASGEVPIADGAGSFTMGTPSGSAANAQWVKITKTYTDFSTAAFSNTITLRAFAAKEVLFSCIVKHSTNFQGGGITAYTIDVSDVTGVLLPGHITTFDAKQAVSNTAFQIGSRATGSTDTAFTDVSFAGANMLIKASCDGGHTLNQATQGSIDIWLLIGTMP